jgi:hypothetical protein
MDENMNQGGAPMPQKETVSQGNGDSSVGPVIGIIIIIAVIVIGGLYFWGQRISNEGEMTTKEIQEQIEDDQTAEELEMVGSSDEFVDIGADIDSTNFEGIDSGLDDLDSEF